jgi:hypothetical protein
MKTIAVFPRRPGSVHLEELPKRSLSGNYRQLFEALDGGNGAIKVFCEIAGP